MQAIFSLVSKVPYEGQTYHGSALNLSDLWHQTAKDLITEEFLWTREFYVVISRGPALQWVKLGVVKNILEFSTVVIRELNQC